MCLMNEGKYKVFKTFCFQALKKYWRGSVGRNSYVKRNCRQKRTWTRQVCEEWKGLGKKNSFVD